MDDNNNNNNFSHLSNFALHSIDPNSSFKGMPNESSTRASTAKMAKPNSFQRTKLVDSVQSSVKNQTFVEDKSSISSNIRNNTTTPDKQGMKIGFGKSKLYEICAANHWKPPVFECCKEEGPIHCRMFTFKVIIEIKIGEETSNTIECYGVPHQKKKMAADDAAEGAFWYLKKIGFNMKNK